MLLAGRIVLSRAIELIQQVSETLGRYVVDDSDDQGVESTGARISDDLLRQVRSVGQVRLQHANTEIFPGGKISLARIRRVLATVERSVDRGADRMVFGPRVFANDHQLQRHQAAQKVFGGIWHDAERFED